MGPQQHRVNPLPAPAQQPSAPAQHPAAPAQQPAAPAQQPAGNSQTHHKYTRVSIYHKFKYLTCTSVQTIFNNL